MKMNELPNRATGQSVPLDAKGKDVVLEFFADGDIFFWTDDGVCLEFDRRNTALILAALRQQEKLPKTTRAAPTTHVSLPRSPSALTAANLKVGSETDYGKNKVLNRSVAKEAQGWGATVIAAGKAHRYYYDKRDSARAAMPEHKIGEEGRLA